jgi:hypothetical protein
MAGLLDFTPDQWQALTLLGSGVAAGNAPGGFQAASSLLAEAPMRAKRMSLLDAQIAETMAQGDERKQKMLLAKDAQANQQRLLYGDAGGSGGAGFMSSGDGQAQGGGIMALAQKFGIPPQAIQADIAFNGGKKVSELLAKHGARDMQVTNGYAYDKNNLGPGFMPFLNTSNTGQTSMGRIGTDGLPVVSAPNGAVDTFRQYNSAAAESKPIKVFNSATQREEYTSEAAVTRPQQQPQPFRPQMPQGMPQSGPAPTGNFTGDPAAIMEAITQIRDPQERANAMAAFTEQAKRTQGFAQNGFAAGPSAGEAAAAAGAKTRAEADARFGSERGNERTKRGDKAADMLTMLTRARTLLESGNPTESGLGALRDKSAAFFGVTSQSAQTASALENIAAGLTMNVPRMEGPQGVIDVELYKTNAGRVGNRELPAAERLAALNEVERLQKKYAGVDQDGPPNERPKPAAQTFQQLPPASQYTGKVARNPATGQRMRSNGLSWVEEK